MHPNITKYHWGPRGAEYIRSLLDEEGLLTEVLGRIDLSKGRVWSYVADHFRPDEMDDLHAEAPWSRDDSEASMAAMREEMDHVRRYLASNRASLVLILSPIGQASAARPGGFRQVQVEARASGEAVWSVQVLSHADASGETVRDAVCRAWAYPFVAVLTEAGGEESRLGRAIWSMSEVAAMCERLSLLVVNALEDEIWLFWERDAGS